MIKKLELTDRAQALQWMAQIPPQPGFHWTPEKLQEELEHSQTWGLWQGAHLVSLLCFRELPEANEIILLGSDPRFRRQGWMRRLLQEVIDAHSQKAWWLEVHENNLAALELYKSLNFQPHGRRPAYYADGGAAILMSREPESRPKPSL